MEKAKILVVEDDNIVAMDIQEGLETLGYDVSAVVSSGEEAIKKTEETHPNLVLMDVVLKGSIDGVETARVIRDRFNIPVVYLTAYADENTLDRAKITEPSGYILKPFEERQLYTNIKMALYKHNIDRKLKESKEWLDATLKSIGDAVIVTDTDRLVIFMNAAAEVLTGWKHDEALGKGVTEVFNIIDEETRILTEDAVTEVLRDGVGVNTASNTNFVAKNGTQISIADTVVPVRDDKGNIIGAALVICNITESERAEREIQKLQKEIGSILIRLMVVSSTLFRGPIRKILDSEKEIEIVAEASTHLEIIPLVEQKKPDVLLIDTALSNLDIPKIMQSVGGKSPGTKVLLMLHIIDEEAIINAISLGAQGYLTATSSAQVLIQAIRAISKDEIWAERKIITKVIGRFLATRKSTLTLKLGLTKREDEIVKLIIQGYSNKQIANKLSISNQTVKNHLVNVFNKLGISNRLNLVLNLR